MSGTNTIELYDQERGVINTLTLYRIMSIGHLDRPNEDTRHKAVLRACEPQKQLLDQRRSTTYRQQEVIIPEEFKDIIFEAFNRDLFVLAEVSRNCITALVMLSKPMLFDVTAYEERHREQAIKAIDGSL